MAEHSEQQAAEHSEPVGFTEEQTAYIKEQVEAQEGFTFVSSHPVETPTKMFLSFTHAGQTQQQNTPVGGRKDWLTDKTQFESVVADAVDAMVKRG